MNNFANQPNTTSSNDPRNGDSHPEPEQNASDPYLCHLASQFELAWGHFLTLLGSQDAWRAHPDRENTIYDTIVQKLKQEDALNKASEENLVEKKMQIVVARRYYTPQRLERQANLVMKICDGAAMVELVWAQRFQATETHNAFLRRCDVFNGQRAPRRKSIFIPSFINGRREVEVHVGLQYTAYYLGHMAGGYILRYRGSQTATGATVHHTGYHANGATLDPWLKALEAFQYCGQVPRPVREYIARARQVVSDVIKAIISILSVTAPGLPTLSELWVLAEPDYPVGISDFAKVWVAWKVVRPSHGKFGPILSQRMRANLCIRELLFLFFMIPESTAQSGPRWLCELQPLIEILKDATGWTEDQLVQEYHKSVGTMVIKDLLNHKNSEHILIYEDDQVENIHKFYGQDNFRSDPLHPSRQYQRIDCSPSLELVRQYWEDDTPPESPEDADEF